MYDRKQLNNIIFLLFIKKTIVVKKKLKTFGEEVIDTLQIEVNSNSTILFVFKFSNRFTGEFALDIDWC